MNGNLIAIDPGANGGISILHDVGVIVHKMPEGVGDLCQLLRLYNAPGSYCFLELVHEMPSQRGMFNFGKGYGHLEMALYLLNIPTEVVSPQKWIKYHCLGTRGGMTGTEWKNKLKAKAQMLYPQIKVTLWNADSLLILDYAINKRK